MMAKRRPFDAGKVSPIDTLVRLLASRLQRRLRAGAVLEVEGHPRLTGRRRRVGDQHEGLQAARAADFAAGERPARAGHRGPGALCASYQLRLRPPHRALDDDRHVVGRPHPHRARHAGERPVARVVRELFLVDPDGVAAVGGHRVGLGQHRPVGQQVVHLDVRRRRVRVGDQHEHLEERSGRALGEEPAVRRRRDAGALVAGGERLAGPIEVHRPLDDDRLAGGDHAGDVGAGQLRRGVVDRNRRARVRRQRVGSARPGRCRPGAGT